MIEILTDSEIIKQPNPLKLILYLFIIHFPVLTFQLESKHTDPSLYFLYYLTKVQWFGS